MNQVMQFIGSLKVTLLSLLALFGGVLWAYNRPEMQTLALVGPLFLCVVNLLAAIASQPRFRQQPALLGFHLALLAVIVLVALGRLTYLKGRVELTTGTGFDGVLQGVEKGPWHRYALADVSFVNTGFEIDYYEGIRRNITRNRVRWTDRSGAERSAVIGDDTPLVLRGYRFYTTFNKGFAPVFTWRPDAGAAVTGSVHLPGYPINEYRQANTWHPPGATTPLWVQLQFDDVILDPAKPSVFRVPDRPRLVLRYADQRAWLVPGEAVRVPGGELRFEGVTTWMGYAVYYDWTLPWLLASSVFSVLSLLIHFIRRYLAQPWQGGAGNSMQMTRQSEPAERRPV